MTSALGAQLVTTNDGRPANLARSEDEWSDEDVALNGDWVCHIISSNSCVKQIINILSISIGYTRSYKATCEKWSSFFCRLKWLNYLSGIDCYLTTNYYYYDLIIDSINVWKYCDASGFVYRSTRFASFFSLVWLVDCFLLCVIHWSVNLSTEEGLFLSYWGAVSLMSHSKASEACRGGVLKS